MAQWVNRLRNKIFVNPPPLPLLCEISGALHLAQPGLTAGWLSDEIMDNIYATHGLETRIVVALKYVNDPCNTMSQ